MEIETDEQIRAEADAFPADEHQNVVVRQDEREHGEHEEIEISEEAVVAALVGHVADRVNVDEHAHAGDEEEPDGGKGIEEKTGVGVEGGGRAIFFEEGEMAVAGAEPGVDNFFERLASAVSEVGVVVDGETGEEEGDDDYADANGADGGLLQAAAEKEHHRGAEGREERDQPNSRQEEKVTGCGGRMHRSFASLRMTI